MTENEDDPWASLRASSKDVPEAGQFAYTDGPPPAAKASPWKWIKLWFVIDFIGWLRKQLPLASQTLDSTYYLGYTRKKKMTSYAVKKVIGKDAEPEQQRIPILVAGYRVGVPGFLCCVLIACFVIYLCRTIFGI